MKWLLFIATLLYAAAANAAPRQIIRLYTSEVPGFVKAWQADPPAEASVWKAGGPLTVMLLSTGNTAADQVEAVRLLAPITKQVMPGLRVGPLVEPGSSLYFDRAHWTKRAAELRAISQAFENAKILPIHIEVENFVGGGAEALERYFAPGKGRVELKAAMQPFLDAMGERPTNRQWWPFICPAQPDDVVCQLIAERSVRVTALQEWFGAISAYRVYGQPGPYYLNHVEPCLKQQQATEREWRKYCPKVKCIVGLYEEVFYDWGQRFMSGPVEVFGNEVWTFNRWGKNASREGRYPSRALERGALFSSLNDCSFFPLRGFAGHESWNRDLKPLEETWREGPSENAPPITTAPYALDCYWPASERYLQTDSYTNPFAHTAASFSMALDVFLPEKRADHQAIGGVWFNREGHSGSKEWQLRLHGNALWFDCYDSDKLKQTDCGALAYGWNRLVLTWDQPAQRWTINGVEIDSPKQYTTSQWRFNLGKGSIRDGGEWKTIFASEMCFRDLHYWGRALTANEQVAAKTGKYPWGI